MYQITKLSQNSRDFISQLSLSGKSRTLQTSLALGRVLSNNLPLPTSEVESIVSFFNVQYKIELSNLVSTINEICLLDCDVVLDFALKFYAFRYKAANPDCVMLALNKETALVDFFSISKIFDEATIKTIQEDPIKITDLINKFTKFKEEINSF